MRNNKKLVLSLKKITISAALMLTIALAPIQTLAGPVSFNDTSGHWADSYISWAVEQNLAQGYNDGSFQPNKPVNEAEFLAMLLRAYGIVPISASASGEWTKPYYEYASSLGWPLNGNQNNGTFRRGQAASIIAAAVNGKAYTEMSAIQWLLDEKISQGRTSATVRGFIPDGKLTRAEALTFFYNLKLHSASLSTNIIIEADTALGGIALNDSLQKLIQTFGKPSRIDPSEYSFSWYVYNSSYSNYMMFGVKNNRVTALFSNASSRWRMANGIKIGQSIGSAKKLISVSAKNATADDYYVYSLGSERTTLFIDSHDSNKIIGIIHMNQAASKTIDQAYNTKLQAAFEQQVFDLANAERAVRGIAVLQWDKLAAAAALSHSKDMKSRDYFAHENPDGLSPFDRMKQEGVKYRAAAENLAAGYPNSIYAHYGWMNSKTGHREALIDKDLERLGTGVAFGGSYHTYYTQNFYTPL
ncbi:CAP-associated domain-containing protein [Paenibacillus sp. sgz302251]|uniref:CAP-associated domain-containing protein n=1 Tax=Paenibacillus sp. sgz302251 TaxID=3414493 RepID=UPI003C79A8C7